MAVFDATTLLVLLAPNVSTVTDSNGAQITYARERVDGLVAEIAKAKAKIVIPTPALSEALVRAGEKAGAQYLARIRKSKHFRIADFDERAAVEVALMTRSAIDAGDKRDGSTETWAKIKYDRQIVAIAKVNGANVIYTDDENLRKFALRRGLRVVGIADLPIPDEAAQTDWVEQANVQAATEEEEPAGE